MNTNYFEMELAKRADRMADRCRDLEAAIREIRRAVTAPKSNEHAIGEIHDITTRVLRDQ